MTATNRTVSGSHSAGDFHGSDPDQAENETGGDSGIDESSTDPVEPLPLDQVFDILKNERRRTVLSYLEDHEEPVSLGHLAEHVAANENDVPVKQISSDERKCAYVGLYQCHLPKMDSMDIVNFNQNRGRIEIGPNADQLKEYVGRSQSTERPWPLYYAGLSGVGVLTLTGTLALGLTGSIPLVVAVLFLLAMTAIAGVHHGFGE